MGWTPKEIMAKVEADPLAEARAERDVWSAAQRREHERAERCREQQRVAKVNRLFELRALAKEIGELARTGTFEPSERRRLNGLRKACEDAIKKESEPAAPPDPLGRFR